MAPGAYWDWPAIAGVTVLLLALLTNIFERKQEARRAIRPHGRGDRGHDGPEGLGPELAVPVRFVSPNVAAHDDQVRRTRVGRERRRARPSRSSTATPGSSGSSPGYAFALDYRDRRGHALRPLRPGADPAGDRASSSRARASSATRRTWPLYRFVGKGDVRKGFEQVSGMPYAEARNLKDDKGQLLIQHPVACVDCHEPKTMARPASRARPSSPASRRSRPSRGSPTTIRTGTPRARRCARSCAASATSSTTSRVRARS